MQRWKGLLEENQYLNFEGSQGFEQMTGKPFAAQEKIYDKLTNILPNLYDDYYKEYLIAVSNYPSVGDKLEENEIMKTSLKNTLMNSRNIMYVGIWIILIAILLFILDI